MQAVPGTRRTCGAIYAVDWNQWKWSLNALWRERGGEPGLPPAGAAPALLGGGTEGLLVIRSPGDHGGDARCAGPPSWADALRPGNMEPRSHGVVGVPVTFCPGPLGPCDSLWIKGPLRDSVLQPWDSRGWGRKAPGRAICRVCGGWVCIRATLGAACLFVREIPPCGRVQFLTEIFPGSL